MGHFSRAEINFKISFLIKFYIITVLKLFWSLFVIIEKDKKMDVRLYFYNVISKWLMVLKEINHWCFRVFGPYFIGKSHCTTYRLTFEFWSIIVRPYPLLLYRGKWNYSLVSPYTKQNTCRGKSGVCRNLVVADDNNQTRF